MWGVVNAAPHISFLNMDYFFSKFKKSPGGNFSSNRRYYIAYSETTTKGVNMWTSYAIEIRKEYLALITSLNDGIAPELEEDAWMVFDLKDDGSAINSKVMSNREVLNDYDVSSNPPICMVLKPK
jgi:hypothetical protein